MLGSGILESVINYKKASKNEATHFIIYNREKIRYLISLKAGKVHLVNNISTYSKKLNILMKCICFLPFQVMEKLKLGYFINAELCDEVEQFIEDTTTNHTNWNVIVGTYDRKQKIVIQLWDSVTHATKYYKIGNESSDKQMVAEMSFLEMSSHYNTFCIPKIVSSQKIQQGNNFNIQLTEEFSGEKVEPILTEDIYRIFKEISEIKEIKIINGVRYSFSHGDFAPWNIKKKGEDYILFDWEHCGIRFYGFDLIHFIFQTENLLNRKSKEEAIELAISKFIDLDNLDNRDKDMLIKMYFDECKRSY